MFYYLNSLLFITFSTPKHKQKTVFYEPDEVELVGMLYKTIYAGPPEYTSIEMGDASEEVTIITLREPIDVEVKENDNFSEPEKGVRELQVVFSDSRPSQEQTKGEITLSGTLYHSHTAHHRRRVLMMVENGNQLISNNYSHDGTDFNKLDATTQISLIIAMHVRNEMESQLNV